MTIIDLLDCVWPTLEGPEEKEPESPTWQHVTPQAREVLKGLIAAEDERRKGTDTKLQGLLILATATGTFITGLVTFITQSAQAAKPPCYEWWSATLVIIAVMYIITQLLRSLWAVTSGLTAHAYQELTSKGVEPPAPTDTHPQVVTAVNDAYDLYLINEQLACHSYNGWVTNKKLSQLKLAYRALRNAITVLVMLTLTLAAIAIHNLG